MSVKIFVKYEVYAPDGLRLGSSILMGPWVPQSDIVMAERPIKYPNDLTILEDMLRALVKQERGLDLSYGEVVVGNFEYIDEEE